MAVFSEITGKKRSWSPVRPGGLILWIDPLDISTVTAASGAISAVADKSGTGNNLAQSTEARRPTWDGALGIRATAMKFYRGDGQVRGLYTPSMTLGTFTLLFAFRSTTSGDHRLVYQYGGGKGFFVNNNAGGLYMLNPDKNRGWTLSNGSDYLAGVVKNGATSAQLWLNAAQVGADLETVEASATTNVFFGTDYVYTSGISPYANIGEVLIYNSVLSAADRQKAEGYLAWRWWGAGTPLPADHPYKYARP